MAVIVADSDVLIDFLDGREPAAAAVQRAREANVLVTTSVSRFEILSGARTDAERARFLRLLDEIKNLPLDAPAADQAATVYRALEKSGKRIEPGDCLIAGIVLHHGGILLTRNRKHFERVEGLTLA